MLISNNCIYCTREESIDLMCKVFEERLKKYGPINYDELLKATEDGAKAFENII